MVQENLFECTQDAGNKLLNMAQLAPSFNPRKLLHFTYPHDLIHSQPSKQLVTKTLDRFAGADVSGTAAALSQVSAVTRIDDHTAKVTIAGAGSSSSSSSSKPTEFETPCGHITEGFGKFPASFVPNAYHNDLLADMALTHSQGDMCIVGDKGVGKSVLVEAFARQFGYAVRHIMMHK